MRGVLDSRIELRAVVAVPTAIYESYVILMLTTSIPIYIYICVLVRSWQCIYMIMKKGIVQPVNS